MVSIHNIDLLNIIPPTKVDAAILPRDTSSGTSSDNGAAGQISPQIAFLISMMILSLSIVGCWIYYAIQVRLKPRESTVMDLEKGSANPFSDSAHVHPDPSPLRAQHVNLQPPTPNQLPIQLPPHPPPQHQPPPQPQPRHRPPIVPKKIQSVRPRSLNSLFSGYRGSVSRGSIFPLLPEMPESVKVNGRRGTRRNYTAQVRGAFASPKPPDPQFKTNGFDQYPEPPPPSYRGSVFSGQGATNPTPVPVIRPLWSNNPYTRMS